MLVVDDHQIFRQGLVTLLAQRSNFEVVGQAANGREAIERAAALKPDVVLMDINMPVLNGIEATRQIVAANGGPRVVGLSMNEPTHAAEAMRAAGAVDYVPKDVTIDRLCEAVERAAGGGMAPSEAGR